MVDEEDGVDGDVHEVPHAEHREREEKPPVLVIRPYVTRDHTERSTRGELRGAVVADPEECDRARQTNESGRGENPRGRDHVDERTGDRGRDNAGDRSADANVGHRLRSLTVGVDPLHQRGVGTDVRDADDEEHDGRDGEHQRRHREKDTGKKGRPCQRHRARDDTHLREPSEEVHGDRRKKMADERRCDHDRDVGGGPAEPPHDDRHERDEDGDIDATTDGAEGVDPEISTNARGCPVLYAVHARNRTLARSSACA